MQEQREFTRVRHDLRVQLECAGRRIEGHSRDLSVAGAFVRCSVQLAEQTACVCTLELGDNEVSIRARARVVRSAPDGIALHFEELLGFESYLHLRELVRYNTDNLAQVEREYAAHLGLKRLPEQDEG